MMSETNSPSACLDLSDNLDIGQNDEIDLKECLRDAEELKLEGNDHFRAKRWNEALFAYRTGLGRLPKRKEQRNGRVNERLDELDLQDGKEPVPAESEGHNTGEEGGLNETRSPLEEQCMKARAVMNANIGACYVNLSEHKEAIDACTEALKDDPSYVKALQRRASSNETINSWSSLSSTQEDYSKLLMLLPPSSPQLEEIKRKLQQLKPRVEAAQKRETDEMLGKLKGLGNSILGNFGLSTDNFKFEPNGQGGYSMNFSR